MPRTGDLDMQIKEIARAAGVTPQIVRFYARAGLITPVEREANGYRRFARHAIDRIRFIRNAQTRGLTLNQIRELLADREVGTDRCCARIRARVEARLRDIRSNIAEFEAQASVIERTLGRWQRGGCEATDVTGCPVVGSETPRATPVAARAHRALVARRAEREPPRRGRSVCAADDCGAPVCQCQRATSDGQPHAESYSHMRPPGAPGREHSASRSRPPNV